MDAAAARTPRGVDGGNGVYLYTGTSAFPNQTFSATNYWVDVVFSTVATSAWTQTTAADFNAGTGSRHGRHQRFGGEVQLCAVVSGRLQRNR